MPHLGITVTDISILKRRADADGNFRQSAICLRALGVEPCSHLMKCDMSEEEAWAECSRVIKRQWTECVRNSFSVSTGTPK